MFEGDIHLPGTSVRFEELRRILLRSLYHGLFARDHGDIVADMGLLPPVTHP